MHRSDGATKGRVGPFCSSTRRHVAPLSGATTALAQVWHNHALSAADVRELNRGHSAWRPVRIPAALVRAADAAANQALALARSDATATDGADAAEAEVVEVATDVAAAGAAGAAEVVAEAAAANAPSGTGDGGEERPDTFPAAAVSQVALESPSAPSDMLPSMFDLGLSLNAGLGDAPGDGGD